MGLGEHLNQLLTSMVHMDDEGSKEVPGVLPRPRCEPKTRLETYVLGFSILSQLLVISFSVASSENPV